MSHDHNWANGSSLSLATGLWAIIFHAWMLSFRLQCLAEIDALLLVTLNTVYDKSLIITVVSIHASLDLAPRQKKIEKKDGNKEMITVEVTKEIKKYERGMWVAKTARF